MIEFIRMGGYPMYVLLVVAAVTAAMAVRSAFQVGPVGAPDRRLETGIDGVLFWGAYAVVVGLLGTVGGIFQAAGMMQLAGGATATLVWSAIRVSLTTTIVGLIVFSLALLAWYALRGAYRRRIAPAP